MTDSTTKTIDFSDYEWQRVPVGSLQVGSRFRFIDHGNGPIDDVLFVVLHVRNSCFFQVFATEWIDCKTVETSFQELSLKASDFVLVTAFHEQSIENGGTP